jgi:hypothetical protein
MSVSDPEAMARKERKAKAEAASRLRAYQTVLSVVAVMLAIGAYVALRFREWAFVGGFALLIVVALIGLARLDGKRRTFQAPKGAWRDREMISDKEQGLPGAVNAASEVMDKIRNPWKGGEPPGGF